MIIEEAAKSGIEVLAAFGEFPGEVYREFKKAGLTGYALKFETSNEKLYREIKPGKELKTRLKAMEAIRTAEIGLATGSIIGLAGQNETIREQDRMLTLQWDPFWVPIVPYLPVPGTPMASTDNRPETAEAVRLTLEEIRHLRRLLPHTLITANQPSLTAAEEGRPLSFADLEGRQAALKAGANFLFWDATPAARRGDLQITENRKLPDWQEVRSLLNENTVSGA